MRGIRTKDQYPGSDRIDICSFFNATHSRLAGVLLILVALLATPGQAIEPKEPADVEASSGEGQGDDSEEPAPNVEERVRVVGSTDKARESTGSEQFIGKEELSRHQHTDVQRVLRRVPGVYLQDEDGYGLRPNIGLRGSGVERSQKVTLMEDGVLIAPAPYSAPSAYYFPTAGRMESVEVSKGPSSIRQGPNTTGGVLNLISRSIPNRFSGFGELAAGEDGHVRGKLGVGNASERFGWFVETFQQQTDGFKELDGGGDTGFEIQDYVGKLRINSAEGAPTYQSLELKIGATDQTGDETYLGLTQEDFDETPYRRYVASSEDRIETDHEQLQLRHFIVVKPNLDVTTTVYHNSFFRNWHKLQSVAGEGIAGILADPDASDVDGLIETIRGEADSAPDDLKIRNNRRDYFSQGIQSVVGIRADTGRAHHEIEVGLRLHEDEEDRFQEEDGFQMLGGSMQLTALGAPGSQSNRVSSAEAVAVFVRDAIRLGRWRLEPGMRFESVDFTRRDYGKTDPLRTGSDIVVKTNDVNELIPGVGVTFDASRRVNLFGGVHKGFAPPGPGQDDDTDPEQSVNYELGARFVDGAGSVQAVAFFNDYRNLLGTDTASSGGSGTGDQFNGGEVDLRGVELSFHRNLLRGDERSYSIPFQLAYTYTEAEFQTSFETSFADWAPEVHAGDELPYLPPHQLFAEIGWRGGRWGAFASGSWVDAMRTRAGQGTVPENEAIEEHLVFDASGEFRFHANYRVFVQMRNVTDEVHVAARRPAGLRPGLPRTVLAGFGAQF